MKTQVFEISFKENEDIQFPINKIPDRVALFLGCYIAVDTSDEFASSHVEFKDGSSNHVTVTSEHGIAGFKFSPDENLLIDVIPDDLTDDELLLIEDFASSVTELT